MTAVARVLEPDDQAMVLAAAPRWSELPVVPHIFVVPAYNERDNLPRLLDDLAARPWLFPAGSKVIVVDDGSDDGTADVVTGYNGPLTLGLVRFPTNRGPGAAFQAGFDAALADCAGDAFIVTLEADTTSDLDALPAMLRRAADGSELVLASVHAGGRMIHVSPWRRMLSKGAGFAVRRALGVDARTVSSFFRVYHASVLRAAAEYYGEELIQEAGFACQAELLVKLGALGVDAVEVPVDLDGSRRTGESKMKVIPTLAGYGRLVTRRLQRTPRVPQQASRASLEAVLPDHLS